MQYCLCGDAAEQWTAEQVERSVQRLSLILVVEEQESLLMVKDNDLRVQVSADRS